MIASHARGILVAMDNTLQSYYPFLLGFAFFIQLAVIAGLVRALSSINLAESTIRTRQTHWMETLRDTRSKIRLAGETAESLKGDARNVSQKIAASMPLPVRILLWLACRKPKPTPVRG